MLAFAGLFYFFILDRYPIGYFNDDAHFLLLARSLINGHYQALHLPGQPPNFDALPGWPLFLMPWVGLLGIGALGLKWVSAGLVLASGCLFGDLLANQVPLKWKAGVLGVFFFHPLSLYLSGSLLSEPLFLFFVLLSLWAIQQNEVGKMEFAVLSMGLAGASLARPEGMLLSMAVVLLPQTRSLWPAPGVGLGVGLMAQIWLSLRARGPGAGLTTSYAGAWGPALSGGWGSVRGWGRSAVEVVRTLVGDVIFPMTNPSVILLWGVGVGALLGVWVGGRDLWKKSGPSFKVGAVFSLLYLALHILWPVSVARYFFVLLPLFLWACGTGWSLLFRRWRVAIGIPLVFAGLFLAHGVRAYRETKSQIHTKAVPRETLRWIRNHTDPFSVLLSMAPSVVYLHSSRSGLLGGWAGDREEFYYQLFQKKVSYVLEAPFNVEFIPSPHGASGFGAFWSQRPDWVSNSPHFFSIHYENPSEGTRLYFVSIPEEWGEAYKIYGEAMEKIQVGNLAEALPLLESSLLLAPRFGKAAAALGTTLRLQNQNPSRAMELLKKALVWNPDLQFVARHLKKWERPEEDSLTGTGPVG